ASSSYSASSSCSIHFPGLQSSSMMFSNQFKEVVEGG
ncbi:hypothetical protein LINPERPRIM_LOCUS23884, partial [Linum perenne]